MAVHGFKGLGWFICGAIVAPACYMVTSHGAAERARLKSVESAIIQARKDIRGLETEFDTRANLAQIERWNGDVLAMAAPAPQQYLASVSGLAALDQQPQGDGARVETASLVIPAGASPVQAVAPAVAQTASAGQGGASRVAAPQQPVVAARRVASADSVQDKELKGLMRKVEGSKLAMSDRPVLSASTIDDLRRLAKREQLALR